MNIWPGAALWAKLILVIQILIQDRTQYIDDLSICLLWLKGRSYF